MSTGAQRFECVLVHGADVRPWVEHYLRPQFVVEAVKLTGVDDIPAGANELQCLEDMISAATHVLVVLSPGLQADTRVEYALNLARDASVRSKKLTVIPVAVMPGSPPPAWLGGLRGFDFSTPSTWRRAIRSLWAELGLSPDHEPRAREVPCPYPGIRPFTAAEAAYFGGRESEVDGALRLLSTTRLLAVLGASGVGKTSLIHAAILPRLRDLSPAKLDVRIWRLGRGSFPEVAHFSALPRAVCVFDQFEEVLQSADAATIVGAVTAFVDECQRRALPIFTIVAVRADFYDRLINSELWRLVRASRLDLAPLDAEALRAVIAQPAARVGVTVEPALVNRLADDMKDGAALPFLQEVLRFLWPLQEFGLLTEFWYARSGEAGRNGIELAIARQADGFLQGVDRELPDQGLRCARALFLRLLNFPEAGPVTKRTVSRGALLEGLDEQASVRVYERMIEQRLILVDAQFVELSHDSLVAAWPLARAWIAERQEAELARRRLEQRASAWSRASRRAGWLDRLELAQFELLERDLGRSELGWSDLAASYIQASRQRVRWGKLIAVGVVLALASAALVTVEAMRRTAESESMSRAVLEVVADGQRSDVLQGDVWELLRPRDVSSPAWLRQWQARIDGWLSERSAIIGRLPAHRRIVEELAGPSPQPLPDSVQSLESVEAQLARAVEFSDEENAAVVTARVASERVGAIQAVVSSPDYAEAWKQTIAAIRADAKYGGWTPPPSPSLFPLGKDSSSGLFEFLSLPTGDRPVRGPEGWSIDASTGLILVLVPGGDITLGARRPRDGELEGVPNVESAAQDDESPLRRARLSPFLLSKYEMTQAQWQRLNGQDPSTFSFTSVKNDPGYSPIHPVESISWFEARAVLQDIGATLPTEDQWEYAARAATSDRPRGTKWWTGDEPADLVKAGALEGMADGYKRGAPVGRFRPNAFGLYDTIGNVFEWTGSIYSADPTVQVSDGDYRIVRGGCYGSLPDDARSARRTKVPAAMHYGLIGVRPAFVFAGSTRPDVVSVTGGRDVE